MTVPPIYVQQKNQICKDEVETVSVYPQLSILQKCLQKNGVGLYVVHAVQ